MAFQRLRFILLLAVISGCKQDGFVMFLSEKSEGVEVSVLPLHSHNTYRLLSLDTLDVVLNSVRASNQGWIAVISREKSDWLHGRSTRTTLDCYNFRNSLQVRLSHWNPGEKVNYSWARNTNTLFYSSAEPSKQGIYRINLDVLESSTCILKTVSEPTFVRISDTGNRLAFVERLDVFLLDLITDSLKSVGLPSRFLDFLEWIPNTEQLLILTESGFYRHNLLTGSNIRMQIEDAIELAMSPDGNMIAYSAAEMDQSVNIYTVLQDGSAPLKLTSLGSNTYPTWSADGKHIIFASNRDGSWELYDMKTDGSNQRRLTNNTVTEHYPLSLREVN